VGKFVYGQNPKSTKNRFQALCGVKVAQIMRKDVVTIREDAALCEAAKIMLIQKARRLPVLDAAGKVTGIIARNDILRALDKEAGC
jgi:predicted transcriptional regulator